MSYIFLFVLISFLGGRRVKPRAKSPFCPVCIDGGSIPVDLLTSIFYHEWLLMSNNFFFLMVQSYDLLFYCHIDRIIFAL